MNDSAASTRGETSASAVQARPTRCDVSVVICTVNRPHLLIKAISSVATQENRLQLDYEIVVVDNSADSRSRESVQMLSRTHIMSIRYVCEQRMSFAFARNAGISAARGGLIAFFDDDQKASPRWLDALVETQRRFDADVVFGPILPEFEGGRPPAWDPEGRYHTRDLRVPTGTEVSVGSTGNALLRRETCVTEAAPFSHDLGTTGGEDVDFFMRLQRRGRKLVWSATASVTELQPADCLTLAYRSYRYFCQNQTYVRIRARNSDWPLATKLQLMAVGTVQALVYSLPGVACWLAPTRPLVAARLKLCSGLGKLLWMLPSRLYAKRYGVI